MPVVWNFKKWLAVERNIYRPSELQALIAERAGVQLSLTAVSALVNGTPSAIRCQTMLAVVTALDCDLCDFFTIRSDARPGARYAHRKVAGEGLVRLYGRKEKEKEKTPDSIFPDPRQFLPPKKP
jgi:DNA-binding Xre family transcriptional regulator